METHDRHAHHHLSGSPRFFTRMVYEAAVPVINVSGFRWVGRVVHSSQKMSPGRYHGRGIIDRWASCALSDSPRRRGDR